MKVTTKIPELKFIGCGNAFNTELGNTSAYFKFKPYKDSPICMVLFDCGNTVPNEIMKNDILDDVDKLLIIITHMHGDHVGGLPTLLDYCRYVKNVDVMIMSLYPNNVSKYLGVSGNHEYKCYDNGTETYVYKYKIPDNFNPMSHFFNCDRNYPRVILTSIQHTITMPGTSIMVEWVGNESDGCIFYIADVAVFPTHITSFNINKIKQIYIDTCNCRYDVQVHLHCDDLEASISRYNIPKNKITCIHSESIESALICKEKGFNIPDIVINNSDNDDIISLSNEPFIQLYMADYDNNKLIIVPCEYGLINWLKSEYPIIYNNLTHCTSHIHTVIINNKYNIAVVDSSISITNIVQHVLTSGFFSMTKPIDIEIMPYQCFKNNIWNKLNTNHTKHPTIIATLYGTGAYTYSENHHSKYKSLFLDKKEFIKGNEFTDDELNNYIDTIKNYMNNPNNEFDIIFISAHGRVLEKLYRNNIYFECIVYEISNHNCVVDRVLKSNAPYGIIPEIVAHKEFSNLVKIEDFDDRYIYFLETEEYINDDILDRVLNHKE